MRVSTQLIRIADDTHLWAETYDRVFDQIFELQSEIAADVATGAGRDPASSPTRELAIERAGPPQNMDAYDLLPQGP